MNKPSIFFFKPRSETGHFFIFYFLIFKPRLETGHFLIYLYNQGRKPATGNDNYAKPVNNIFKINKICQGSKTGHMTAYINNMQNPFFFKYINKCTINQSPLTKLDCKMDKGEIGCITHNKCATYMKFIYIIIFLRSETGHVNNFRKSRLETGHRQ
jgi:hypothetical protein